MNPFTQLREEFVEQIIGITNPFLSNAITALLFLAFLLFMIYAVKILIRDRKEEKERKKRWLHFEKEWISLFKNNTKIKK